jgi:hypothetical protein
MKTGLILIESSTPQLYLSQVNSWQRKQRRSGLILNDRNESVGGATRFVMEFVVLMGFVEGYVLLPLGLASFLGSVFLTAFVVWRLAPKYLR